MSALRAESRVSAARGALEETRGALIITPIGRSSLEDTTCPICQEHYSDPPSIGLNLEPELEQEWAVSVDHVAEWFGLKRCCGHILGRRCLEQHLNTTGTWRNKCPICRDLWFHEAALERAQFDERPSTQARFRTLTPDAPRRSQRIAARLSESSTPSPHRVSDRSGISRKLHHHQPRTRPPRFMQQLLAALEVEDVKDGVKGTKEEVQRRLESLYRELR
jgi:hypothetical protein